MGNIKRSRWTMHLRRIVTAAFAAVFCFSFLSTFQTFAAANIFIIEDAKLTELSENAEGDITSFNELEVRSNVTFHKVGDTAKYTLTIKNNSDEDRLINYISDNNESNYLSYEYNDFANSLIKANETFDFIVTVKYKNAVNNLSERTQISNVKFLINYADGQIEIPLVPDTSGNMTNETISNAIKTNTLVVIISAIGLIICIVLVIKKRKEFSKVIIGLIFAVSAITATTSARAIAIEINSFSFINNFNLADKLAVTYVVNGEEKTEAVPYGSKITEEIPSNEDYDTAKWVLEDGTDFNPETPIRNDLKLIAKYEQTTLHVNFMGNGLKFKNNSEKNVIAIDSACHEEPAPQAISHTANIRDDGTVIEDFVPEDFVKPDWISDDELEEYMRDEVLGRYPSDVDTIDAHKINGASSLKITLKYAIEEDYDELYVVQGYFPNGPEEGVTIDPDQIYHFSNNEYIQEDGSYGGIITTEFITPGDSVTFNFRSDESVAYFGYFAAVTPLDENGNELPSDRTITVCGKYIASGEYLEPEHNEKQEFLGWSNNSSRETLDYETKNEIINNLQGEPGETKTLYAVWLNNHSITYNPNGGQGDSVTTTEYGGARIVLNDANNLGFTRENYDFIGWSEDKNATTPTYSEFNLDHAFEVPDNTGTTTLYAVWRKKHIVHYNGNDADSGTMPDQYISVNSYASLHSNNFVREHYDFLGWSENKDATESNYEYEENGSFTTPSEPGETTLYAVWRKQHRIVFDANGGQGTMIDQWESIYTKVPLNNNQFSRSDYGFVGWSTDKNAQTATYENKALFTIPDEAGGTTILYAIWVGDHRIIFDANGGQGTMEDQYVKIRTDGTYSTVSLNNNTFTRQGYQFLGWSTNKNATSASYLNRYNFTPTINATGSTTLYAIWKQQHRIIFDANGGQGTMADQYVSDGGGVYLRRNTFEREGFAFIGWNTNRTATTAKYTDWQYVNSSQLSGDQTILYAIWVRPYYIEFKGNGDDVEGEMEQTTMIPGIGQEGTLIPSNYERNGYGFAGWSTDQDAASKIYNTTNAPKIYGPNETITLDRPLANLANSDRIITMYAVWIPKSTEYTFQNFDKSAFESAHPNEKVVALEDTRDGNVYLVAKLADGNWWMTENMRLDLTDPNTSITADNTNNPSSSFLTSINAYKGSSKKTLNIDCETSNTNPWSAASRACYNKYGFSAHNLYRNSTSQEYQEPRDSNDRLIYFGSGPIANSWYSYGAYYGFRTANAGYPTYDDDYGKTYPGDICPKGWKLPTGLKNGDFITLQTIYGTQTSATGYKSYENWFKFPNNVVKSGFVAYDGERGGLVTSYVQTSGMFIIGNFPGYNITGVSVADDYPSNLIEGDGIKGGGAIARAVRCIAK